jgi:hypothetical protein
MFEATLDPEAGKFFHNHDASVLCNDQENVSQTLIVRLMSKTLFPDIQKH